MMNNSRDFAKSWTINGRFLTQRMTGVQRYAYEIVDALDRILAHPNDGMDVPAMRLAVPPGIEEHILKMMSRGEVDTVEAGPGREGSTDQFAGENAARGGISRWRQFQRQIGSDMKADG